MNNDYEAIRTQQSIVLRLIGICRRFIGPGGAIDVLKGANLTLSSGETIALLGPSGSGKSTLLHIAGLLEMPSRGRVEIEGCMSSDLSDRSRSELRQQRIGFVYQFHHLMDEFSAVENVMIPQMIGGLNRRQARNRAEQLLAMVRLADRLDHRPAELSGGERQRVAIARALANAPVVLLADEPTGNLDNRTAEQVFSLLLTLAREIGLAMLIATHNLELAGYMDRVVLLKNGILVSP